MYWVTMLFIRLKSNWKFVEFDKSKTIKNKYINQTGTQR